MSTCTLNTHLEYDLNSVQFDKGTGKVQVKLSNPPPSCPDGFFTSKGATVTEDANISVSKLTYTNHPVILVPSKQMVQVVDSSPPSSFGFGTILILAAIVAVAVAWYKGWLKNTFNKFTTPSSTPVTPQSASSVNSTENSSVASSTATSSFRSSNVQPPVRNPGPAVTSYRRGGTTRSEEHTVAPVAAPAVQTVYQPAPVIVHDNGPGNFLTGMLVGQALSGDHGYHHDTEIIHEREVVHDRDHYSNDRNDNSNYSSDNNSRYSSDDDSSNKSSASNSYSSDDNNSSYSSDDSGSSYSSDSSSSYSSDSGSSDSGSSFSSDF